MPRASDKIAAAEVTLLLRSRRQANTKSARSASRGTEPNARASPRNALTMRETNDISDCSRNPDSTAPGQLPAGATPHRSSRLRPSFEKGVGEDRSEERRREEVG